MTSRVFLGMLTPSSNTVLEPITTAMISALPEVTAHFSRFKANYGEDGYTIVADQHLRMQDNFSFSTVTEDQIRAMTKEAAAAKPDAIAIVCTNMRGAPLAEELEAKYGIPIYDTISTTVWGSLRAAGVD